MKSLALMLVGLIVTSASAQLLVGYSQDGPGPVKAWDVDPTTAAASPLWTTDVEVWGLAADAANDRVFVSAGSSLYRYTYGNSAPPTLIGPFSTGTTAIGMVGLAFSNGRLIGTGGTTSNEGVWIVNAATGLCTLQLDYADDQWDFGGLDADPATGTLYATNDDASPNGRGLFRIDPFGGQITKIADYPSGETDIDGLAIGNGIAYLVEDEPGATIHRYDLTAGVYLTPLSAPFVTSELFGGATFIPEPAGLLLALPLVALIRRRG